MDFVHLKWSDVTGQIHLSMLLCYNTELSTGRMDPRVGSGHDFSRFWRVGSGQVSTSDF